jgi:hypothetical protein
MAGQSIQFEIGVADALIGVVAIVSFRRSLDFKVAVSVGVTIGHFRDTLDEARALAMFPAEVAIGSAVTFGRRLSNLCRSAMRLERSTSINF